MATTGILIEGLDPPPIDASEKRVAPNTKYDPDSKRRARTEPTLNDDGSETEEDGDAMDQEEADKQPRFSSSDDDEKSALDALRQPLCNTGGGGAGGAGRSSDASQWRSKQPPAPFTDKMNTVVRDKLAGLYENLPGDDDMDLYDMYTIPGLGKKKEIIAWSMCSDEGYDFTLEQWGEYVQLKIRTLKWIVSNTPILATMAMDLPIGRNHRISVRNIMDKIRRVINGNMGTYTAGATQLWRPKSLSDANDELRKLGALLITTNKLPPEREVIELLKLQLQEIQSWLIGYWEKKYEEPMPPDVRNEDVRLGMASKLVADWVAAKAERKAVFMVENVSENVAVKAVKWKIERMQGFVDRRDQVAKAAEQEAKRKADAKEQRRVSDQAAAELAAKQAARAELLRQKGMRKEARQRNRMAQRQGEPIDPDVEDAGSESSELSDELPMPPALIDHGALLLYGVSEETTQQLQNEADGLQTPMPTTDPDTTTILVQALEAVRIIASNTDAYDLKVWKSLIRGYRTTIKKQELDKYAAFFMKAIQRLQYANVETFNYFSAKRSILSNYGFDYEDDVSLRPGPPQPGIDDEIQSVINAWYSVLVYAQRSQFDRKSYAKAVEAVARILRDLGSFDQNSWTVLVSAYNKAKEFEGEPNTITNYLYMAIRALYGVNPETRAYTTQLFGSILPAAASPPASEVAEEYDEDFEAYEASDDDKRPLAQKPLPSQPPESQAMSNDSDDPDPLTQEEQDPRLAGAGGSQTQLQSQSQLYGVPSDSSDSEEESDAGGSQTQLQSDSEEEGDAGGSQTQLQSQSQLDAVTSDSDSD